MKAILILFASFICLSLSAQNYFERYSFTRQDSLRGYLNENRTCYDVLHYDLSFSPDFKTKSITGTVVIEFLSTRTLDSLQVDLFEQFKISSVQLTYKNNPFSNCAIRQVGNARIVEFGKQLPADDTFKLHIDYFGEPNRAIRPPWDGGFIWPSGKAQSLAVACQGHGASSWWPCKDHPSDEPEKGMNISITTLKELDAISNGQLVSEVGKGSKVTRTWRVSYPINNYNVTFYIGNYDEVILDTFDNRVPLSYYVLQGNRKEADEHFAQVHDMLRAFEHYFGPYPFSKDGFKLVEAPYWGMEHQSAIAYGNHFKNNNYGFDYIIVHESGHEWWGNHVSMSDNADMWIHESFTTYSEALFMEYHHGYEEALAYLQMQRHSIMNQVPIRGPFHVNFNSWPGADMYYKGSWMLHTLRCHLNNDEKWFACIKAIQSEFSLQQINSTNLISFMSQQLNQDLESFFAQYLDHPTIPILEYEIISLKGKTHIRYRLIADINGLELSIPVKLGLSSTRIQANQNWQKLDLGRVKAKKVKFIVSDVLVDVKKLQSVDD